jgi:type IV secretion system protein VirB10
MDENKQSPDNAQHDALAALSEVTPRKKTSLLQTPVFKVIAGLCLLFVVLSYFSESTKAKPAEENTHQASNPHNPILNQNLAHLNALKDAESKQKQDEHDDLKARLREAQIKRQHEMNRSEYHAPTHPRPRVKTDQAMQSRMQATTNFINVEHGGQVGVSGMNHAQTQADTVLVGKDTNSQFINQNNPVELIKAGRLAKPDYTLAAGELIEATLETAINSQLPGMVRAFTLRDVYSLDAARILIPKGSHLIGQYATGNVGAAQTRLLIAWTRVQLPNGVIATLNSPSTDTLGRAGLGADDVHHHFLERFGASVLFSVLGAYSANAGVNGLDGYNSASQYRMSVVQSFQKTSNDTMNQQAKVEPTLSIHQGHQINVFAARDISFYDVMKGSNA